MQSFFREQLIYAVLILTGTAAAGNVCASTINVSLQLFGDRNSCDDVCVQTKHQFIEAQKLFKSRPGGQGRESEYANYSREICVIRVVFNVIHEYESFMSGICIVTRRPSHSHDAIYTRWFCPVTCRSNADYSQPSRCAICMAHAPQYAI